ncbi:MAG TPA: hypothetical protein VMT38_06470 [Terracidiphilus sp.]|nr:hypothetical protein [Terracidiphilus sp.]
MLGWFAASHSFRRTPLALGLSLLAFLFAIEAKTAWYGPATGFGGIVRAAKAQPVTSPEVVEHGVPAPDPAHPGATFFLLPPIIVLLILCVPMHARGAVPPGLPVELSPEGLSFSNLFRPPPIF